MFFGERGSEEFAGYGLVDLGVTYQVPVWSSLALNSKLAFVFVVVAGGPLAIVVSGGVVSVGGGGGGEQVIVPES